MKYTTLAKNPEFFKETMTLIEKSFDYSAQNSFQVDFAPLVEKKNHHNCHIIIERDRVIAHIGVSKRFFKVEDKSFPIDMYGGIAVDESHRGQGIFKKFFEHVLALQKPSTFHILWSDQIELYEKFSFFPCIEQLEYDHSLDDVDSYSPTTLSELTTTQIATLNSIYNGQKELRVHREVSDWESLKLITSSSLYIKKENDEITNYFLMNKGEDLNGVIIEVGNFEDYREISKYGVLWSPHAHFEDHEIQFAALLRVGTVSLFKDFISLYTKNAITISTVNTNIEFSFENKEIVMEIDAFLTGIFGPGRFEELTKVPPIYISGLDSI